MKIIKIENIELSAESLLTTDEVAIIYGVTAQAIREHKRAHQDELIENRHFIMKTNKFRKPVTYWTLEGIYMLGFFIKSERAKKYRKAIAQLLKEIKAGNVEVSPAKSPRNLLGEIDNEIIAEIIKKTDIARGYQGQIKKLENELAKKQSQIENYERLLAEDADLYFQALESFLDRIELIQNELDKIKSILTTEPNKQQNLIYWGKTTFPRVKYPRERLKRIINS